MNKIFFCIQSTELNKEIAWCWKDQKKQFFKTWVPTINDILLIDELDPEDREIVKHEIMREIEPELIRDRELRNKRARERRENNVQN